MFCKIDIVSATNNIQNNHHITFSFHPKPGYACVDTIHINNINDSIANLDTAHRHNVHELKLLSLNDFNIPNNVSNHIALVSTINSTSCFHSITQMQVDVIYAMYANVFIIII
jgi:hypothetical protein